MISRFARSFMLMVIALLVLAMVGFLHPPARSYIDPWTGQLFGEGGVESSLNIQKPKMPWEGGSAKGGVIMSKLGNATAKAELGRASWKLLHTMTLRYPEEPTEDERNALDTYFHLFSRLYPCGECAAEFQELLKKYPPQTSNRRSASLWLCFVHNEVNKRLEKPEFDCAHLDETYDCGCGDDPVKDHTGKEKEKDDMDLERDSSKDDLTGAGLVREGIKVVERFFEVPLDHGNPSGEKIRVFARNMIPRSKAKTKEDEDKLPFLVYLQGGPGFEVPLQSSFGFAAEIHDRGYQTLWLDQRGTGLSTPFSYETLPANVKTDQEIANYLKYFRADSIVKDCEVIRKILLGHREKETEQKWSIMGQSFGGFCAMTYLSFFPQGLKEVFITGGLAPLIDQPDVNYEHTIQKVIVRNKVYYEKYPRDIKRASTGHSQLLGVQQCSAPQWWSPNSGIDRVHQIVLRAANDLELYNKLTYKLLQTVEICHHFDENPIYAILHEPIYCQGHAANWAASRVVQKHPQFSWANVKTLADTEPLYFTGEMIFPGVFDDYSNLRPLKGAAELIAQDASWGPLYDIEQLKKNEVPVTTATYYEDMYVPFELSQQTASTIKNTEQYITNQLQHGGIREDPKDLMRRLFQISKREHD
uniref:Sulfhydryl oxidase n=1 Tax=Moniliophthora roreri TaxID=221103 RepID=A0A0W0FBG4_MONRR